MANTREQRTGWPACHNTMKELMYPLNKPHLQTQIK